MLEILDTAGQEEYAGLREQWIRHGDGFVLVYSITSRSSFTRIQRLHSQIQRVKESLASSSGYTHYPISSFTPSASVPIILVGNKSDRTTDREVSVHEGRSLAQKLGCRFLEASAKNPIAVEDTISYVVRQLQQLHSCSVLKQTRRKKRWARNIEIAMEQPLESIRRITSRKPHVSAQWCKNAMSTDTIPSHIQGSGKEKQILRDNLIEVHRKFPGSSISWCWGAVLFCGTIWREW